MSFSHPFCKGYTYLLTYLLYTNSKFDITSHWLPTAAALPIMDPNEPGPFMKLSISIEHDSLQYHTSMLIDLAATLNFASRDFLTRNDILGKCTRDPKKR